MDKANEAEIILQTQPARTFAEKRQADFEDLQSQPGIKPKPRNKANQNHRRLKRKQKTLKPILATRKNEPETLLTKENLLNKKNENLKTCKLKTRLKHRFEKCHH